MSKSDEFEKKLLEDIKNYKAEQPQVSSIEDLEKLLFNKERTVEDTLPRCGCGGKPRLKYAHRKIWIECLTCKGHSAPEDTFPLTRNSWYFLQNTQHEF